MNQSFNLQKKKKNYWNTEISTEVSTVCFYDTSLQDREAFHPSHMFALRHINTLESEEQQEGHHKTEQTHSFRKGETQNSIGEQLLFQRWISSVTNDKGTKYCSDTGTCLYWKDLYANSHNSILIYSKKKKKRREC
uniref:Uncharacterized protein n=1 Tax=Glossina palpalis gambiensis TaxID=67801 RepID=A0A1B0BHP1_9MUSC